MTTGQPTSPDSTPSPDSRFSRTVMDIQDRMTGAIRAATSRFIGGPINAQTAANMTAEVQANLDVMADAGVISNSTLESVVMRGDTIDLNYTVQPASSIVTIHPPAEESVYDAIRANAIQQIQEAEDEQILTQMELAVTAAEQRMARAREGVSAYRAEPVYPAGTYPPIYEHGNPIPVNMYGAGYENITDILGVDVDDKLIGYNTPFSTGFRRGRNRVSRAGRNVTFDAYEEIGTFAGNVAGIRRLELYSGDAPVITQSTPPSRRSAFLDWNPYRAPANSLATVEPTTGWAARPGELTDDLVMMGHITAEQAAAFSNERLGRPYATSAFDASYVAQPADRSTYRPNIPGLLTPDELASLEAQMVAGLGLPASFLNGRDTTPKLPQPEPKPKLNRWDILLIPKGE
jgi:hypothetical protein